MNKISSIFKKLGTGWRKINPKLRKIFLVITIIIVVFVGLVIAFFSPIAKYLIEKYDVKYIGREVKVGVVYANPFTAYIHIGNLRLYELKGDSVFISAKGLSVDYNWTKMIFSKTYEISSLTLDHPVINVKQQRQSFNFKDIIDKFTPKEKKIVKKARTKFNILDIDIIEGRLNYREFVIPVDYYLKNINISSPGMWWNRDTMAVKFAFKNGPSTGDIKGDITINLAKKAYRLNLNIKKFDLSLLEQYVHDMANYGHLEANLDANIHASGDFSSILGMNAKGFVAVNDFHFGRRKGDDFFSFDRLSIGLREVNPKKFRYYIDSIILTHPFFVYETYNYLDNLQRMFGEGGSKVKAAYADSTKFNLIFEAEKQIQQIAKNFLESYYKVGRIEVKRADIGFRDFSMREKFAISLNPLFLIADSLDKNHQRLFFKLNTDVIPYGKIVLDLNIDPNDYQYFDGKYRIEKIPLPVANPYLITYTSFPLDRGSLDFTGAISVVGGNINSSNHLVILDPRVGPRLKKKEDTKWIPVPLIMAFVRERGNVIDYEIPITGNLKNPKIHFKDIIFDLLKNIFIKPPTSPYAFKVRNVENEIEKSLTLKWEMRQTVLRNGQEKFIDKIADFLKKNPEASITVQPDMYAAKEKEYILIYEAKKKYLTRDSKVFMQVDSENVEKMSVKDSQFIHYLNARYSPNEYFTIQEQCMLYVGENLVNTKYNQLIRDRERIFRQYFKDNGTESRVKFAASQNIIPFNGFSYFKIKYKGDVPQDLTDAYEKLDELNESKPRRKYLLKRKRDKSTAPIPVPGK